MREVPTRVFLGWDGPLLDKAVEWIASEFGDDCSGVILALPGGRAGRTLREKLARKQTASWQPPRTMTQGELTDELVRLDREFADRIVRTLVWERALRSAPKAALKRILDAPPESNDASGWHRLAETLRTLHGELAPEGCEFASVAQLTAKIANERESARWKALAKIQDAYRKELAGLGIADPHEARFEAIERGEVECSKRIVLVGVADMNHLLRRALEPFAAQTTAIVFAPEDEEASFDEWGGIRAAAWRDRNVPLKRENWLVADKPADQARLASEWLATRSDELRAENVTIGIADEEVAPFVERRLAQANVRSRHAAGFAITRTLPYRLIEATASFLRSRNWTHWAVLVRHPDFATLLGERDGAQVSDAYHGRLLPDHVREDPHGNSKEAKAMHAVLEVAQGALGKLVNSESLPLSSWSQELRELLVRVYGEQQFDEAIETERVTAAALKEVATILTRIEALPSDVVSEACSAAEALEFVQRELRSGFIPPAQAADDEPTVELLGWLELPLDDAEALVVTGFSDGRVPETLDGDQFLPNGLRSELGLADAEARQARDVHVLTLLCHSRNAVFISGRRRANGDPLVPSRLAFHCAASETPERVRQFIEVGVEAAPEASASEVALDSRFPLRGEAEPLEKIRVTAFRDYLSSPYQFYLRHILGLKTLDDDAREFDAAKFGTLAHDVLKEFGDSAHKNSCDPQVIEKELITSLKRLTRSRYGKNLVPAAQLQIEQLSYRLHLFATKQAEWADAGWEIKKAEWSPDGGGVSFDVDGTPIMIRGQVDRIDHNTKTGEWAILDYKTSDKPKEPGTEHYTVRADRWNDLQLPLYCLLTASLGMGELPRLGYINIGRDEASVEFSLIKNWDEDKVTDATDKAREVVRCIREGKFAELGRGKA